jgi:L-ascorbate metabolism protein UlaG (beta-lactamase superfamily)
MKISKYIHSCVLVEKGDRGLLIDPGPFTFMEGKVNPEDFNNIDAILITHNHSDHFDKDSIKKILNINSGAKVITTSEVAGVLNKDGIEAQILENDEIKLGEFQIKSLTCAHEPIPMLPLPTNLAFVIDDKFLHPGDSLDKVIFNHKVEALALPVAGPFLRMVDALAFATNYTAKEVMPIHDAMIKEFFTDWQYQSWQKLLEEKGMHFNSLKNPGDSFEIS